MAALNWVNILFINKLSWLGRRREKFGRNYVKIC